MAEERPAAKLKRQPEHGSVQEAYQLATSLGITDTYLCDGDETVPGAVGYEAIEARSPIFGLRQGDLLRPIGPPLQPFVLTLPWHFPGGFGVDHGKGLSL